MSTRSVVSQMTGAAPAFRFTDWLPFKQKTGKCVVLYLPGISLKI